MAVPVPKRYVVPERRVLIPVANDCCEVHLASLRDCFLRALCTVVTACIDGDEERMITTKLNMKVQADARIQDAAKETWDLIVLPGGRKSVYTMRGSKELLGMLDRQKKSGKFVGATGLTPPIVLASIPGFLEEGATCYPNKFLRKKMPNASDNDVVVHHNVVTSQGIGQISIFGLVLVELLHGEDHADLVASSMLVVRPGYRYRYDPQLFAEEGERPEMQQAAENAQVAEEKERPAMQAAETAQAVKEADVEKKLESPSKKRVCLDVESSSSEVMSPSKKTVCFDVEEVPVDTTDGGIGEAAYRQEDVSTDFDPGVDDVLDDSVDTNISDDDALVRRVDSPLRRTSLLDDSSKDSVPPASSLISHNEFPIPDDDDDDDDDGSNCCVQLRAQDDDSSRRDGSIGGLSVEEDETAANRTRNMRRRTRNMRRDVIVNDQTELSSPHIRDMLNDTSDIVVHRAHPADWEEGQEEPVTRLLLPPERLLTRPQLGDDGTLHPQLLELWRRTTFRVSEAFEEQGEEIPQQRVHGEEGLGLGRSARDRESEGEARMSESDHLPEDDSDWESSMDVDERPMPMDDDGHQLSGKSEHF